MCKGSGSDNTFAKLCMSNMSVELLSPRAHIKLMLSLNVKLLYVGGFEDLLPKQYIQCCHAGVFPYHHIHGKPLEAVPRLFLCELYWSQADSHYLYSRKSKTNVYFVLLNFVLAFASLNTAYCFDTSTTSWALESKINSHCWTTINIDQPLWYSKGVRASHQSHIMFMWWHQKLMLRAISSSFFWNLLICNVFHKVLLWPMDCRKCNVVYFHCLDNLPLNQILPKFASSVF